MWLIIISQTIIGCAHVQNELCRVDFSSVLALPPSIVFNSSWSVTPMWLCSLYLTCVSLVIMTSGCVPVQIYCTLVHPWVTHSIRFKPHFMVSPMSHHPHMLVDSGALGMTSWFPLVGLSATLVHPLITHSIISQTCSSASLMSALPHMLVGFGTLDMASCILPVQFSSTLVYPLITHSVISKTYSLSSSMLVLPHILVEFSLIRCRHSIHIQFNQINAKVTLTVWTESRRPPWCSSNSTWCIWSHPGWNTHHGKVELQHENLACASWILAPNHGCHQH